MSRSHDVELLFSSTTSPNSGTRRQTSGKSYTSVGAAQSFRILSARSFPVEEDHESFQWKHDVVARQLSLKEATSFAPEVVEDLEQNNPEVLRWLRSAPGILFQVALITIYILSNVICALLSSYFLKPDPPPRFKPVPSSLVAMASVFSIFLGFLLATGRRIVVEREWPIRAASKIWILIFHWRSLLSYFSIAVCFSLAKIFKTMSYSKLDVGLVVILDQLRLPLTAAMSSVLFGKKYSFNEWLSLFVILGAVNSFYHADARHAEKTELHRRCNYPADCFLDELESDICAIGVDGPTVIGTANSRNMYDIVVLPLKVVDTETFGLICSVSSIVLVVLASVLSERVMKSTASTPFPAQKAQLETTALPVAVAMSFIVPIWIDSDDGKAIWWGKDEDEGGGYFRGYNELTLVLIGVNVFLSWMGGIIVKQFSTLTKSICKCFVLLLTVVVSGTLLRPCEAEPLPMTMYGLVAIISAATLLFATMPMEKEGGVVPQAPQPQQERCSFEGSFRPSFEGLEEHPVDGSQHSLQLHDINLEGNNPQARN